VRNFVVFFFSSRRRHTRSKRDWSSDVCSSDLGERSDINAYIKERIEAIATGTAAMYELEAEMELVGEGINCDCSDSLARVMQKCAGDVSDIEEIGRASCGERGEAGVIGRACERSVKE